MDAEKILELKRMNAAYVAAQEWDYCPEPKKAKEVEKLFHIGLSIDELKVALEEHQGRRPDEIAGSMSDLIKVL